MAKRKKIPQPGSKFPRWGRWVPGLAAVLIIAGIGWQLTRPRPEQTFIPAVAGGNATPLAVVSRSPTPTPFPLPTATSISRPTSPIVTPPPAAAVAGQYGYKIINAYPHDPSAFTQGLVFMDGIFYEGTGLYGRSTLRKVNPATGEVLQQRRLAPNLFGEGITIFGDKIIQLTWKAGTGFVYDKETFELLRQFSYPTEGWGITHDGSRLIMSDGSDTLYFWDPETLAETGRVRVFDQNGPVVRLNELEYINGEVYANVWQTNRIARINPATGQVLGWITLDGLLSAEDLTPPVDVLNGIAYDAGGNRLFVTGKLWPKLFEIELVPRP